MGMTKDNRKLCSYCFSDIGVDGLEGFKCSLKHSWCHAICDDYTVKAIPKAEYEVRLKADMVAMLTELKKEIEEQSRIPNDNMSAYDWNNGVYACYKVIQQKIDALKDN